MGHMLELAIRASGKSLSEVSNKLGISRNTLYNKFKEDVIDHEFILNVSKIIDYNLKSLMPELSLELEESHRFRDIDGEYINNNKTLKEQAHMYEDLLDQYRVLLLILLKLSTEPISDEIRAKIYKFISELQKEEIE